MFCISCGFKNPDEARFCMKCGASFTAAEKSVAPATPVSAPQPLKANSNPATAGASRAANPPQPARSSFDADRFFASFAVGLGSIVLALILAGIGWHLVQAQTQACTAAILSHGNQSSCSGTGYWGLFLLAFAIASGGLKMASRIGKK